MRGYKIKGSVFHVIDYDNNLSDLKTGDRLINMQHMDYSLEVLSVANEYVLARWSGGTYLYTKEGLLERGFFRWLI